MTPIYTPFCIPQIQPGTGEVYGALVYDPDRSPYGVAFEFNRPKSTWVVDRWMLHGALNFPGYRWGDGDYLLEQDVDAEGYQVLAVTFLPPGQVTPLNTWVGHFPLPLIGGFFRSALDIVPLNREHELVDLDQVIASLMPAQ